MENTLINMYYVPPVYYWIDDNIYDIVYQQTIRQVLVNISAQYTIPEKSLYYYLKRLSSLNNILLYL
jgi:hypothetical protein